MKKSLQNAPDSIIECKDTENLCNNQQISHKLSFYCEFRNINQRFAFDLSQKLHIFVRIEHSNKLKTQKL